MIVGECFCGSIKYEYSGALMNARSCHCSRCRKAFSSAASAYAEVEKEKFSWVSGEALLSYFASNEEWGKCFCSKCGSTLCGMHNGEVHGVTIGCINGDPDVELQMHIFVDSKAKWEDFPNAKVKQFKELPSME